MAQPNFVQRLQIKNAILISTPGALIMIFIKTVSDVFAHASYKCLDRQKKCGITVIIAYLIREKKPELILVG